ncbi:UDP-2,3-diacylglucosamine diphosphatase LpxI [Pelagibacteraceae bacterium]|nr:UDP-2,3-diacylglucosamine diphosphatase LpxI [Pelagibacteraceae bacterium]
MNKKIDNLALIGGDNELPLLAYNSIRKKFKNFIYVNISRSNKKKLLNKKFVHHLKIFELEKCINLLSLNDITQICFLGTINRPDFSKLKLDNVLSKYINSILVASKQGDGNILDSIINIFELEGYTSNSLIDIFPNEYLLDRSYLSLSNSEIIDINKGITLLNTLSEYDNAQACVISNGYILAIEAVEGTDKMLSRVNSIKRKISRNITEGALIKLPKTKQNLKIDLPTVGPNTLKLMYKNKLKVLGVNKNSTIVVEKLKFYKLLNKYQIKLYFVD